MDPWNRATPYASSNGSRYGNSMPNFGASSGSRYGNSVSNIGAFSGSKYGNSVSNLEAASVSRYGNSLSNFGASSGSRYGNSVSNLEAASGSRYGKSLSNFGASSGSRYGNSVSNFEAASGSRYRNLVPDFGASSDSRYGNSVSNLGAASGSRYGNSLSNFGATSGSRYGNSVSNLEAANGSRYGNSLSKLEAASGSRYGNSVPDFGASSGSRYGNSVSNLGAASGSRYGNSLSNFGASSGSRYGNSVSNFVAPSGGRYENPRSNFEALNRRDTHKKNIYNEKWKNKSSASNTNSQNYTFSENEKLRGGPSEPTKSSIRCIEGESALSSDCLHENDLRRRDSFSHKNHNSVVVKSSHHSAVAKTEMEESSHFEELFDYQAETRPGKRDLSPNWEHVVEPQRKKQNVNSDRMQLDCASGQINGNKASKKQNKSTKKQKKTTKKQKKTTKKQKESTKKQNKSTKKQKKDKKSLNTLNRMVLKKPIASKLMYEDGVNFLQTIGKETKLMIRVEKHKIKRDIRYVCAFHGASDRKAEAQEAVERFLYPIGTRRDIKAIPFKMNCNFANLKENLEMVDSSEKYWTHLASLRYYIVQKKENLWSRYRHNKKLMQQVHRNYSVLNAMVLGKLDVADGPKHMQVLRQWLQESNESTAVTKTIRSSFDYVFNYGSALDIDYSEVIKRFSNGAKLQEKIDIKGILESGVSMCIKHGWKEDLNYYKSLYEKIIISNYSTDSIEQFKKNDAQLKAKMEDYGAPLNIVNSNSSTK